MIRSTTAAALFTKRLSSTSLVARRFLSSGNTGGPRGNRIAGLKRFYRIVNIEKFESPPWASTVATGTTATTLREGVESPISAGVDGTQSASGVAHPDALSRLTFAQNLIPRRPGETDFAKQNPQLNLEWYGVTVDGRVIKTPMGQTLAVPSALLAAQIAAEWDAVTDQIQPTQMPLMRLACTTLDQTAHHMSVYQEQALNFVPTDTLCFWADPTRDEERILYQRQEESWDKVHQRVTSVVGEPLATASGKTEGIWLTIGGSKRGLPHPPSVTRYSESFCSSLDAWHLTALNQLASEAKSFWLAWALLTDHDHEGHLFASVKDAVEAFRLEEEVQIENWGMVEGGHDYDRLNASVTVRAALLLRDALELEYLQQSR